MATFIVFADSTGSPHSFSLGKEIAQANGLVTIERTFEAPEPQPDGTTVPSSVLSIQEDGSVGWRPRGTNGPFELAQKVNGFYLFGPSIRLRGNLAAKVFPVARFEEFTV